MIRTQKWLYFVIILLIWMSCAPKKQVGTHLDTSTSGTITIAADESLRLLVEAETKAFESAYPKATFNILYVTEAEAFNLLAKDSARMIVVTRKFNDKEREMYKGKKISPDEVKVARDGLAFITNQTNSVSKLSQAKLQEILSGKLTSWNTLGGTGVITVVFDNENSGTVRYCQDSILKGAKIGSNVSAVKTNPEVIEYVKKTPGAIGVIGAAWISNNTDPTTQKFTEGIKVLEVEDIYGEKKYGPYQYYLATGEYPYFRDVMMLSTETFSGLATGFINYTTSDVGQTIINKLGLLPVTAPIRTVTINNE